MIDADVLQMRQLLQNLIGNALKFAKPGEAPRVEIGREILKTVDGDVIRIRVQDHGIGFDEKISRPNFYGVPTVARAKRV